MKQAVEAERMKRQKVEQANVEQKATIFKFQMEEKERQGQTKRQQGVEPKGYVEIRNMILDSQAETHE